MANQITIKAAIAIKLKEIEKIKKQQEEIKKTEEEIKQLKLLEAAQKKTGMILMVKAPNQSKDGTNKLFESDMYPKINDAILEYAKKHKQISVAEVGQYLRDKGFTSASNTFASYRLVVLVNAKKLIKSKDRGLYEYVKGTQKVAAQRHSKGSGSKNNKPATFKEDIYKQILEFVKNKKQATNKEIAVLLEKDMTNKEENKFVTNRLQYLKTKKLLKMTDHGVYSLK